MLTLALADELSGRNTHFGFIKPPFVSENPYDLVIDKVENISDKYFGESKGSCKMYETLYGFSDFRRYILGTNNRENSKSMFLLFCQWQYKENLMQVY